MSRVINLSKIKQTYEPPEEQAAEAPVTKRYVDRKQEAQLDDLRSLPAMRFRNRSRIAWHGGKIVSNKGDALAKFLQRKQAAGETLTAEQAAIVAKFKDAAVASTEIVSTDEVRRPGFEPTAADYKGSDAYLLEVARRAARSQKFGGAAAADAPAPASGKAKAKARKRRRGASVDNLTVTIKGRAKQARRGSSGAGAGGGSQRKGGLFGGRGRGAPAEALKDAKGTRFTAKRRGGGAGAAGGRRRTSAADRLLVGLEGAVRGGGGGGGTAKGRGRGTAGGRGGRRRR